MSGPDATKSKLLESAGEEFAIKGLDGATVREICLRAGVNQAAVNYHFRSKEGLYAATVIAAHRCKAPRIEQTDFDGISPADALRLYIRNFLKHVLDIDRERMTWHSHLMMREILNPTEACDALVKESIRPQFEQLLSILRQICRQADETRLQVIAFSIVGQCLHYKMAIAVCERLMAPENLAELGLDYLTDHISGFTLAALGLVGPLDESGLPGLPVSNSRVEG